MKSAILDLQSAIHARLDSDDALITALGPDKIFDRVPPKRALPYVTFGQATTNDWSTDQSKGDEHLFLLKSWSRNRGAKQSLEVIALVENALLSAPLTLSHHHLVLLEIDGTTARFDSELRGYVATLRVRALTENPN